jgi:hypothetical protein
MLNDSVEVLLGGVRVFYPADTHCFSPVRVPMFGA